MTPVHNYDNRACKEIFLNTGLFTTKRLNMYFDITFKNQNTTITRKRDITMLDKEIFIQMLTQNIHENYFKI